MTQEQRHAICEVCTNKEFSPKSEILCSLSGVKPAFENSCDDFSEDFTIVTKKRRLEAEKRRLSERSGELDDEEKAVSPVRIVIGVVLIVLVLLKWLIRCDSLG